MGLLDGDEISNLFGDVFGEIYADGILIHVAKVNGRGGNITSTTTNYPCKVQRDNCDKSMMSEEGYVATDVKLILLRAPLGNVDVTTDDKVTAYGVTYSLKSVRRDAANSHFVARGRKL